MKVQHEVVNVYPSHVDIRVICPVCNEPQNLRLTRTEYDAVFKDNELIQRALPLWPKEQREILLSGMCPTCWNIVFPE